MPYLSGWSGDAPVSEISGRMRVQAKAGQLAHLRYTPPLFYPGFLIAMAGLISAAILLARPAILSRFIKTRPDERK